MPFRIFKLHIPKPFTTLYPVLAVLIIQGSFFSCKYEDGPAISFRSKLDRVSNFWMIKEYTVDGKDSTEVFSNFTWRFGKDFSFDFSGTLYGKPWSRSGEWFFENSRETISMLNLASDSIYTYDILRLRNRQLWLRQEDPVTGAEIILKLKQRDIY